VKCRDLFADAADGQAVADKRADGCPQWSGPAATAGTLCLQWLGVVGYGVLQWLSQVDAASDAAP